MSCLIIMGGIVADGLCRERGEAAGSTPIKQSTRPECDRTNWFHSGRHSIPGKGKFFNFTSRCGIIYFAAARSKQAPSLVLRTNTRPLLSAGVLQHLPATALNRATSL